MAMLSWLIALFLGCTKQEAFLALVEGMVGAAAGKTVASQWTAETGCENESLAPSILQIQKLLLKG